ncbi:MAG: CoA transferase [Gluconacetobacter diazotrophicus]|nr:CoA transferase [Gluconacetobacter diazotrophicus]
MAGPLDGVRVLDLTSMISGPLGTQILGDQGADVIKVENPRGGDHTRAAANRRGGMSATFLNNNRNKRSVALDLKRPSGVEALLALARDVDVFVQNFRPGVAERIGVGEAAIRAVAPRVIYVSISGFGEEGPFRNKPVYDPLIQAVSGLATVQAGSDAARPRLVRTIVPDKLSGIVAAQAIAAALFRRERTGEGQHVRLSMLDAVYGFLWGSDMGSQTFVDGELPQQEAASFQDLIYEVADGAVSIAVQSDKEWAALCAALEQPGWREDPRFRTVASRGENIEARLQGTQDAVRGWGRDALLARLEEHGVPCAPVLTRNETIVHPQVAANGLVEEREHPAAGRIRQGRPAARFSGTPQDGGRLPAPALGEHAREALREAGLDGDGIEALAAAGAFGSGEAG